MTGVSVIVCCYNSESRIADTLQHLAKQMGVGHETMEVILVDNNCTDKTAEIAVQTWTSAGSPFPLKIVEEKVAGLNAARFKGVAEAKFDFVCFCDDDNWLDESYVLNGLEVLNSDENIHALGGEALPVFEDSKPEWFERYSNFYACYGQWFMPGDITEEKGWLYGAGLFFRKAAIAGLYDKLITTDRKGKSLSSGGDGELCYLVVMNGGRIWYDPNLKLNHFIQKSRTTTKHLKRLITGIDSESFISYGLAYRAGFHKTWHTTRLKRSWIYLLAKNVLVPKEWFRYKELGIPFSMAVQGKRVLNIIKWNFNYDKQFNPPT